MQLKREEDFWRQKAGFEWFKDGERNTKKIYVAVKERRSRLKVQIILNDEGERLDNQDKIVEDGTRFYQQQFKKQEDTEDFSMLEILPSIVKDALNMELKRIPTIEEAKRAVMGLNKNSSTNPDGMIGAFFQDAWNILSKDLQKIIIVFFSGYDLPRFITHTNL